MNTSGVPGQKTYWMLQEGDPIISPTCVRVVTCVKVHFQEAELHWTFSLQVHVHGCWLLFADGAIVRKLCDNRVYYRFMHIAHLQYVTGP